MRQYQLSSHVYLEMFDDDAVLLVADRDIMVKVNHAAALLFTHALEVVGGCPFTRADFVDFLAEYYELAPDVAEVEMRSLLHFCLRQRMVHIR